MSDKSENSKDNTESTPQKTASQREPPSRLPETEEDSESLKDDTKPSSTLEFLPKPDTPRVSEEPSQISGTNDNPESSKDYTKPHPKPEVSKLERPKVTEKYFKLQDLIHKNESSRDRITPPSQTPEANEDTNEKMLSSEQLSEEPQSRETYKKAIAKKKPFERFEIPEDIRKPSKSVPKEHSGIFLESLKVPETKYPEGSETPLGRNETKDNFKPETSEDSKLLQHSTADTEKFSEISANSEDENATETPETSEDGTNFPSPYKEKKKRHSIVTFFTGQSRDDDGKDENPPRRKKRPSFLTRKLIALEKQLDFDNINKKSTRVYQPEPLKRDEKSVGKEEIDQPEIDHLSSTMACIFIIGSTTGSALANLPYFLMESSWFGVFLNLLLGFNSLYAGLCTGWCWSIMEEQWPEYLEYTRVPYQDMAFRAVGKWMKLFVTLCIHLAILGTCAGYMILIADTLENIIYQNFNFCYTLITFSFLISPFMMFSSYRNMRFIGVLDLLCSILFTVLLVISFFLDKPYHGPSTYKDPRFNEVILSLGGFSFAYGSGPVLPSIMADMTDRSLFNHTCATAYMICMVIYVVLPILGYAAYGDQTPRFILQNILMSESYYNFGVAISVLHVVQLSTTYCIFLLPSLHVFEVQLYCPDRFGVLRFLVRITIIGILLVLTMGIPFLQMYADLVSATTISLVTFVFPPIFYACLVYRTRTNRRISKKEWFLISEIILLGIIVVIVSTYTLSSESSPSFRTSCFESMDAIPKEKSWISEPKRGY